MSFFVSMFKMGAANRDMSFFTGRCGDAIKGRTQRFAPAVSV